MKDHWLLYFLLILILAISLYNLLTKPEQIEPNEMREIQREIIREELTKIPKDTTIIEKYFTIREVTKNQLAEFGQVNNLQRDSLFWYYYNLWKDE